MAMWLREEEEKAEEEEENSDSDGCDYEGFDSDGSQILFMNHMRDFSAQDDDEDDEDLLFIINVGKTAEDFNVLTTIEHKYYKFKEGVEKELHTFNHIIFTVEKSGVEEVENVGGVWIKKN
jgi:hypothetical protein